MTHLAGDLLSPAGLPLLHPLRRQRTFALPVIRTGGFSAQLPVVLLCGWLNSGLFGRLRRLWVKPFRVIATFSPDFCCMPAKVWNKGCATRVCTHMHRVLIGPALDCGAALSFSTPRR